MQEDAESVLRIKPDSEAMLWAAPPKKVVSNSRIQASDRIVSLLCKAMFAMRTRVVLLPVRVECKILRCYLCVFACAQVARVSANLYMPQLAAAEVWASLGEYLRGISSCHGMGKYTGSSSIWHRCCAGSGPAVENVGACAAPQCLEALELCIVGPESLPLTAGHVKSCRACRNPSLSGWIARRFRWRQMILDCHTAICEAQGPDATPAHALLNWVLKP